MRTVFTRLLTLAVIAGLTACGGGGQKSSSSANNSSTTAAGEVTAGTAAPAVHSEAVPGDMHCGAEPPVWVNTRSHVYHLAGDPYYGKTKAGTYMCRQNAEAAGDHLAGSMHGMHSMHTSSP